MPRAHRVCMATVHLILYHCERQRPLSCGLMKIVGNLWRCIPAHPHCGECRHGAQVLMSCAETPRTSILPRSCKRLPQNQAAG